MNKNLIAKGAPKPSPSSPLWNEWAANNPTPQAKALAKVDVTTSIMSLMRAIATGARPVNYNYDISVM